MKKIVLLCSAGMSTSLLVNKMKVAAQEDQLDYDIEAYSLSEASRVVPDAAIVLLGPQVRFNVSKLQSQFPDKIVESIDMRNYGTMNGRAVIDYVKGKLGD